MKARDVSLSANARGGRACTSTTTMGSGNVIPGGGCGHCGFAMHGAAAFLSSGVALSFNTDCVLRGSRGVAGRNACGGPLINTCLFPHDGS